MSTDRDTGPISGELRTIRADEIERNPQNPRMIFDPEPMAILRKSIEEVGILTPILVYRKKAVDSKRNYVILDGERRWLCAQEIEKERKMRNEKKFEVPIPANIVPEPTTLQNILMMFNIHTIQLKLAEA